MPSFTPFDAVPRLLGAGDFPCIMAKSVLRRGQLTVRKYGPIGGPGATAELARDLAGFAKRNEVGREFRSFLAAFDGAPPPTEDTFEEVLWTMLQDLHRRDDEDWDPEVSPDPDDREFSFSYAGRAFYVVGLHPHASRAARRCDVPALVFNLHAQFQELRRQGRYEKIRSVIRERDRALAGSPNPMMSDFGKKSDARQYSGRAVGDDWSCPFHAEAKTQ